MGDQKPLAARRGRRSSKSKSKSAKRKKRSAPRKLNSPARTEDVDIEFDVIEEDEGGNTSADDETYDLLMLSAARRPKWRSKMEYFMVTLSYLVGLDHILSFITIFSTYGIAMFVPYFVCLIIFGIPVLYLEMALGQYSSLDSFLLFERIAPAMAGTGYASTILSLLGIVSNEAMAAVALESIYSSMMDALLRSRIYFDGCNNEFNTEDCMDPLVMKYCRSINMTYYGGACIDKESIDPVAYNHASDIFNKSHLSRWKSPMHQYIMISKLGILDFSTPELPGIEIFFFSVLGFAILVYFAMKSIRTMVKLSFVVVLFPLGFTVLIAAAAFSTLQGVKKAMVNIFDFEAQHLLDVVLWTRTAAHMFIALKLGQGGVITLGTYNNFHNDILLDMVIIIAAAFFVPLFFAFTLTTTFGAFIDAVSDGTEDIDKLLFEMFSSFMDPDIFVVTNNGLSLIPTFGAAFLTLASICFFLLALGNMITRFKLVTNALSEKIEILRQPQNIAVVGAIIVLILISVSTLYFTYYGPVIYLTTYMYTVPAAAIVVVLFETITVVVCYGGKQILADTHVMLFGEKRSCLMNDEQQGFKGKVLPYVNFYLISMLRGPVIVVLTALIVTMTYSLCIMQDWINPEITTFSIAVPFGICSLLTVVVVIPVILLYKIISTKIRKRPIARLFKPHLNLWGPQEKAKRDIVEEFERRLRVSGR